MRLEAAPLGELTFWPRISCLAQSRVWRLATDDSSLARASYERILAWDFDRLIVAHGNVVATGARARLGAALPIAR